VAPLRQLTLGAGALRLLEAQDFPGNVRELRNLLERAALLCDGAVLEAAHLQQALAVGRRSPVPLARKLDAGMADLHVPSLVTGALKSAEKAVLQQLVKSHQGSRAALAAQLGISERSLYRKLKSLGTDVSDKPKLI
jgi:DNA-binding NtrC family response regulator